MLQRVQNMLYSTVERRRREMNVEGGMSDDTETDPHYSPKVNRRTLLLASLPTLWYSTRKMKPKPSFSLINFLRRGTRPRTMKSPWGKYIKAPMARVMVERRWRWDGKRRCNQQARSKAPQKNNARKNALFPDTRALRDGI